MLNPQKFETLVLELRNLRYENGKLKEEVERKDKAITEAIDCLEQNEEDPDTVAIGILKSVTEPEQFDSEEYCEFCNNHEKLVESEE